MILKMLKKIYLQSAKKIIFAFVVGHHYENKLAKARKMRKPAGTLGLKKFGPGKLWVTKNVGQKSFWVKKVFFGSKKIFGSRSIFGQKSFFVSKSFLSKKKFFF